MSTLDLLIRDAEVFDGVRADPLRVDVGLFGDRIALVGEAPAGVQAQAVLRAPGRCLCPGFIDSHASTGLGYMLPHPADHKLFQGVTTEVIGNCGTSNAPIGPGLVPVMERLAAQIGFTFEWRSLGSWFAQLRAHGLPFNVATHVGHSTLRGSVGLHTSAPEGAQLDAMAALLREGMRDGALGLSTGLVYAPGSFATTAEIIQLARVVAEHGGLYVSHIRNEREDLDGSIEEALEVGQAARVPVLVSHLKAAERPNWGKIPRILDRIDRARAAGQAVCIEVYPYTAVSTKLRTFIPRDALAEGVDGMVARLGTAPWRQRTEAWLLARDTAFEGMVLITDSVKGARGRSIAQLAAARGRAPEAMVVDVLLSDPDAWIVYHCIDAADMDAALLWPDAIVCSDSWSYPVNALHGIGEPHPRTFGAFTRFLERYALSEGRLPLGEAVRRMTSLPADWLGLTGRGRIREGGFADLTLLDPSRVRERATFDEPRRLSEGTEKVWVNGVLVLDAGALRPATPGRVLIGKGRGC